MRWQSPKFNAEHAGGEIENGLAKIVLIKMIYFVSFSEPVHSILLPAEAVTVLL